MLGEVKVNYIWFPLLWKRNGVICLPIFIAWRRWGLKILEGCDISILLEKEGKTNAILQWSGSIRPPLPLVSRFPPSPNSVTCNQAWNPAHSPFCAPWPKGMYGLSEKKSISTLKTFWKVAYGRSIPTPNMSLYETSHSHHGRERVSLRIDSLPTELEMLASILSLRAMNRGCLAVGNPWGVKG